MSFTPSPSGFYRLPLRFDETQLQQELSQFDETDWGGHSPSAVGDASIIMVSVGGTFNHDFALSGETKPTAFLERCPYLRQALKSLNSPISRCRVTRLAGAASMPARMNRNYHGFRRISVYVPIVTNPTARLFCRDKSIQMAAGDVWTFDHTLPHWMINKSSQDCFHLIVEIRRPPVFEEMLARVEQPHEQPYDRDYGSNHTPVRDIPYLRDVEARVNPEPYFFEVLTPQEIHDLTADILSEMGNAPISRDNSMATVEMIKEFRDRWEMAFSEFGHHSTGELTYQEVILYFNERIVPKIRKWLSSDGKGKYATDVISSMLSMSPPIPTRLGKHLLEKRRARDRKRANFQPPPGSGMGPVFDRPVFIVSAPRAGSTLLFNALFHFPDLWSTGDENHELIENIEGLHPSVHDFGSNRLSAVDATPDVSASLQRELVQELQDRDGNVYLELPMERRPDKVRFLEKTPKNALRIPFFKAVFPDALFIHLYRDPAENISSIMEGWRSRRFISYRNLPGWPFREWNFLLIPEWSSLRDSPLVEIAAYQWRAANTCISEDLETLPESDWCFVDYSDLVQSPKETIKKISEFAGLRWDQRMEQVVSKSLPISERTLSAPSPDKWRKNEKEISAVLSEQL